MRDINRLLEDYKPLILSVYKKRNHYFRNAQDKEDFMSQLYMIFTNLVYEYDPSRGVDFPFYIKRMLELRAGHYITKHNKRMSREFLSSSDSLGEGHEVTGTAGMYEAVPDSHINQFTDETAELLEDILSVESWDDAALSLGKKQEQLFLGILRDNKTPRELADAEGVSISTIHTRMHFLTKKLKEHQSELDDEMGFKE